MWDAEGEGNLHYKNNLSSTREHRATLRENRILVLPVNILMVWCAGFTWPHDTLLCVLIRRMRWMHDAQIQTQSDNGVLS